MIGEIKIPKTKLKYVVYGLFCPIERKVKYIGCTQFLNKRIREHLKDKRNSGKRNWIMWLLEKGLRPETKIYLQTNNGKEALKDERKRITRNRKRTFNDKSKLSSYRYA